MEERPMLKGGAHGDTVQCVPSLLNYTEGSWEGGRSASFTLMSCPLGLSHMGLEE